MSEETQCLEECGEMETHIHYLSYKSTPTARSFTRRHDAFKGANKRLRMESVILEAFSCIIMSPRNRGEEPPHIISHYGSPFDDLVNQTRQEQKQLGWGQLMKGRISSKWGYV